jgi:hypothetical protein
MAGKNTAAYAIFANRAAAERAVDQLNAAGFSHQDVSVLMSDKEGSKDFATEKNTKAPEGTATGVGVGGVVGGTLGLLAGIGALAIPGVGPLIAAGPIMGALAGLGVGGAVGGLVGALVGMGIPEYEAKRYEGRVKDGGILVSVHCESSDEVSRAKDVLKQAGGEDIASSGEKSVSSHHVENDDAVDRDRRFDADRVASVDRDFVSRDRPLTDVVRTREVGDTVYEDDLVTDGTTTKR